MGSQLGACAEYHPRARAPTLTLVKKVSKEDFDGISVQGAANQILITQPTQETSEYFGLRGRDGNPKDALVVRLMGYVQSECVGRVNQQESGHVLPVLETFGSGDADMSGLSAHFLKQFENVIEGIAVVGKEGIGGVGTTFGSVGRFVDKERVVFDRGLGDPNAYAHFSFGRSVFTIGAARNDATHEESGGVARGAKEDFHVGVASRQ
jgi:hypothetical protein